MPTFSSAAPGDMERAIYDTDLNGKIDPAAGGVATPLTASRALASDGAGLVVPSSVTSTELASLGGVTSGVQGQLDAKQPLDADLSALAGIATPGMIANTGAGTAASRTITGSAPISVANGNGAAGAPAISHDVSGVTASTYNLPAIVAVSSLGHITSIRELSRGLAQNSTLATSTLATNTTYLTLALTALSANYLISWNAVFNTDAIASSVILDLLVDGVSIYGAQLPNHEEVSDTNATERLSRGGQKRVALSAGARSITLVFRTENAGATVSMYEGFIEAEERP